MKLLRVYSQRLFRLVWLLAGVILPTGSVAAVPAHETRTALFAAG